MKKSDWNEEQVLTFRYSTNIKITCKFFPVFFRFTRNLGRSLFRNWTIGLYAFEKVSSVLAGKDIRSAITKSRRNNERHFPRERTLNRPLGFDLRARTCPFNSYNRRYRSFPAPLSASERSFSWIHQASISVHWTSLDKLGHEFSNVLLLLSCLSTPLIFRLVARVFRAKSSWIVGYSCIGRRLFVIYAPPKLSKLGFSTIFAWISNGTNRWG